MSIWNCEILIAEAKGLSNGGLKEGAATTDRRRIRAVGLLFGVMLLTEVGWKKAGKTVRL